MELFLLDAEENCYNNVILLCEKSPGRLFRFCRGKVFYGGGYSALLLHIFLLLIESLRYVTALYPLLNCLLKTALLASDSSQTLKGKDE